MLAHDEEKEAARAVCVACKQLSTSKPEAPPCVVKSRWLVHSVSEARSCDSRGAGGAGGSGGSGGGDGGGNGGDGGDGVTAKVTSHGTLA